MNSITKIGKAALSRIFKPFKKVENGVEIERTLHFPKEELNLTKCIFLNIQEENGVERIIYKTKVQIWGIQTGLQDVVLTDEKMLGYILSEQKCWNKDIHPSFIVSHVVLINTKECFSEIDPMVTHVKYEDIEIYRVYEKHIGEIYEWIGVQMSDYWEQINRDNDATSSAGLSGSL